MTKSEIDLTAEIHTEVTAVWMLKCYCCRWPTIEEENPCSVLKLSLCRSPGGQVRYRREHASGRHLPFFPLLEDLMRDVCDGAALLTVVHSYCPDHIKLEGKFLFNILSQTSPRHSLSLRRGATQGAAKPRFEFVICARCYFRLSNTARVPISSWHDICSRRVIELCPALTCFLIWSIRHLPEGSSLHRWQPLQHTAPPRVCQRVSEQKFLPDHGGHVVLAAGAKGTSTQSQETVYMKLKGNDSPAVVLTTSLFRTQQNMMVFIAELFWWFETVKPDFVKPRDLQEFKDGESRSWADGA